MEIKSHPLIGSLFPLALIPSQLLVWLLNYSFVKKKKKIKMNYSFLVADLSDPNARIRIRLILLPISSAGHNYITNLIQFPFIILASTNIHRFFRRSNCFFWTKEREKGVFWHESPALILITRVLTWLMILTQFVILARISYFITATTDSDSPVGPG